jgi:hypothetical protein
MLRMGLLEEGVEGDFDEVEGETTDGVRVMEGREPTDHQRLGVVERERESRGSMFSIKRQISR